MVPNSMLRVLECERWGLDFRVLVHKFVERVIALTNQIDGRMANAICMRRRQCAEVFQVDEKSVPMVWREVKVC